MRNSALPHPAFVEFTPVASGAFLASVPTPSRTVRPPCPALLPVSLTLSNRHGRRLRLATLKPACIAPIDTPTSYAIFRENTNSRYGANAVATRSRRPRCTFMDRPSDCEVAGLGQGGASEVERDHRRRPLPVTGRVRRGGGMTTTNSVHRRMRGRTFPPLAHRAASSRGARHRGQGLETSGCARFSTHTNRPWACPVDFGAKTRRLSDVALGCLRDLLEQAVSGRQPPWLPESCER